MRIISLYIYFAFAIINVFSQNFSIIMPNCNNETSNYQTSCCVQTAQAVALAAAAAKASVEAYAAAQVSLAAAIKVGISATVTASVSANIAFIQSVAITNDLSDCCDISANISADATAYAETLSIASMEVLASADAAVIAASTAISIANAASSIYAKTEALFNSSCCGFDFETTNAVLIAGGYVENALIISQAVANVSFQAQLVAKACFNASAVANATTSVLASVSIDSCCSNNRTVSRVKNNSEVALKVSEHTGFLYYQSLEAISLLENYTSENHTIVQPWSLSESLCAPECSNVLFSCCNTANDSCTDSSTNICSASDAIANVYLAASALGEAIAKSVAWTKGSIIAIGKAIVSATAAAKAAVDAQVSVKVKMLDCCTIKIDVDTSAKGKAQAVSYGIVDAKAAADIYLKGSAQANALAYAAASSASAGQATNSIRTNGCCGTSCEASYLPGQTSQCCQISNVLSSAFNSTNSTYDVATKADSMQKTIRAGVASANRTRGGDSIKIMDKAKSSKTVILKCCCCVTSANSKTITKTTTKTTPKTSTTKATTKKTTTTKPPSKTKVAVIININPGK